MSVAELEATELAFDYAPGLWRDAWQRLRRNRGAIIGFALVGLFVTIAVFAPLLAPFDPRAQDLSLVQKGCCPGPSAAHWFGVDQLGRDELTRIFYGARYSLLIGVVSVTVGLSIGLVLGAIAGYLGGFVDSLIMRAMDVMLSIPGLLLAIGIVAALGPGALPDHDRRRRDEHSDLRALASRLDPRAARERLRARSAVGRRAATHDPRVAHPPERDVAGDRAGDACARDGDHRRRRPRLPRARAAGSGTPEWGTMLTEVDRYLQSAPWLAIIPGIAIVISVLGFNLIGDGLREALDPKLRGRV